jgi:gluconate 5-dehydrogenase
MMKPANPFSLDGKTAVVAGASRGIGQAIAEALARAGARTILASRSLEKLAAIAENLRAEGLQAEALELDIAARDSRQRFAANLPDTDILINVAGTNIRRNFTDYTPEEYSFLLQTNLTGIVELTQAVGAQMIARGKGGKVVNIGSLSCLMGMPYISVYTITKSALAGLTRALAAEWGQRNIQVNCIAPGFILTDLNRKMWEPPEMLEWLKGAEANPSPGTPEDVAPLAVFLSSPGSDYITGQLIAVDGGCSTTQIWPFTPQP